MSTSITKSLEQAVLQVAYDNLKTTPEKGVRESQVYYVIGRTLRGGRFYSEPLTVDEVLDMYFDYVNIVRYFGGGEVNIIELTIDGYDILYIKNI